MSFTYQFPTIIKSLPSVAIPYHDTPDAEGKVAITLNTNTSLTQNTALFRSECTKHVIILDCVTASQGGDDHSDQDHYLLDPEMVEACYHRLTSWWQMRPPQLYPEQTPSQQNLLCAYVYCYLEHYLCANHN